MNTLSAAISAEPAPTYEILMRQISLITTGGTIEKTYDEQTGSLENRQSIVRQMLQRLRLEDTNINIVELMSKDSLDLDDLDRQRISETVRELGGSDKNPTSPPTTTGIVILHGTDTLEKTGEILEKNFPNPRIPIILTGAMRPYEMTHSDALQNLTEAIFATGVLTPGIYCVVHNQALRFPGVTKDRSKGTFVYTTGQAK